MYNLGAVITFGDGNSFYINYSNKISIEMDSWRTKNLGKIAWGIVSNTANVKFKDTNGVFGSCIKEDVVYGAKVQIYLLQDNIAYLNDDLLGTFYISNVDYSDKINEVTLSLEDGLQGWQSITLPEIYKFDAGTLYDVVIDTIGDSIYQSQFVPFDTYEAKNILTKISLNSGINWGQSNLWNLMQKVCEASRCCLYMNNMGKAVIERPKSSRVIIVNPNNIYAISDRQSNFANKIPNAQISVEKRIDVFNEPISETMEIVFFKELPKITNNLEAFEFRVSEAFVGDRTSSNPNLTTQTKATVHIISNAHSYYLQMFPKLNLNKKTVNKDISTMTCKLTANKVTDYGLGVSSDDSDLTVYKSTEVIEQIPILNYDSIRDIFELQGKWVGSFDIGSTTYPYATYLYTNGNMVITGNYYESEGQEDFSYTTNASASVTSLPSNDLILNTTTEGQSQLAKNNLNYVKKRFSKGLETAVLRCSLDNYYDTSAQQTISKNVSGRRTFKKYDIVLPYVIKNGIKTPFSTHADGSAKTFQVVGIRYSNKGVVWQDLYLEEYVNA